MKSHSRSEFCSVESSEWTTIVKKRAESKPASTKLAGKPNMSFIDVSDSAQHSCEEIISEIHRTKAKLQSSAFYNFVTSSIGESTGLFETILSFGIGRLSTPTSLLQLALYLGLCDKYLSRTMEEGSGVFDPNITSVDREVYKALNITVLSENTKGKHTASNRGKTLFFLPHCPYRLYCNTLWANWEQLDKVYIYGNSFHSYGIRRATRPVFNKEVNKRAGKQKTVEETTMDPTDTVALLSSHFVEIDLWPSVGNFALLTDIKDNSFEGVSPRVAFLKESKTVPELRHLENAVCDMSFMFVSKKVLENEETMKSIAAMKPSEKLIDDASLLDVELF